MSPSASDWPGSDGEKQLQDRFDTVDRAADFYESAVLDRLNERMQSFLSERNTVFVGCTNSRQATRVRVRSADPDGGDVDGDVDGEADAADGDGEVDAPSGDRDADAGDGDDDTAAGDGDGDTAAGDGTGLVDVLGPSRVAWDEPAGSAFAEQAAVASHATLMAIDWEDTTVGFHLNGSVSVDRSGGTPRCTIDVEEAYIHCAKHIPRLQREARTFDETTPVAADADLETLYDEFLARRICFMLGTADADGETDISPRFGPQGFVQLTERGLAYPEYRGNGVHASLGNMLETERACFTFLDFWQSGTALHVEGDVMLHDEAPPRAEHLVDTDTTKVWVELEPDSITVAAIDGPAYSLVDHDPPWGTDDDELKRAGFFTEPDGDA